MKLPSLKLALAKTQAGQARPSLAVRLSAALDRPGAMRMALAAVLLLAALLRLNGLHWDGDRKLHPDERFLTSVTADLQWPDSATELSWTDVDVRPWSAGAYAAHGPGGVNWLGRMDPRITGAWMGGGKVGFMWTANRDSTHPWPYIRVVRLLESNLRLIDEPDIWSRVSAWAYPAASGHARGGVGFTAFYGGGTRHPGHVVGVKVEAGWETTISASSRYPAFP